MSHEWMGITPMNVGGMHYVDWVMIAAAADQMIAERKSESKRG